MIFVSVLLAFVACVKGLPGHVQSEENRVPRMPAPGGLFHVYTLPVGQGDARVIQCPSGDISIFDMGTCSRDTAGFWIADDIRYFLGESFPLVRNIFITHNDRDHYSLLDKVFLSPADVTGLQSIYISRLLGNWTQSIQDWVNNVIGAPDKVKTFNGGRTCGSSSSPYTLCENVTLCPQDPGITTKVLSVNAGQQCGSTRDNYKNVDSIVLEITNGSFKLQLNGDFEDCTENQSNGPLQKMADAYYKNVNLTVYMLSHHGAENKANTEVIRNAVRPKAVFVSSDPGYNTRYRHPRCTIIDAFINENNTRLCKPGETNPSSTFYCGFPYANVQSNYTCGEKSTATLRTIYYNDYAIYSTRPDAANINFLELLTDGTDWGFNNYLNPLIKRQPTSESKTPKYDECVDED